MEDKKMVITEEMKMTPVDSLELITSMIAATRKCFTKGKGNMLLFWGYLCVSVAIASAVFGYIQFGHGVNMPFPVGYVWWLIPIIGIPYTVVVNQRARAKRGVVTYSDRLTISLWNYVILLAIAAIVIGMIFYVSGFSVWYVMELFTFFVIGVATSVQGMIIKENSMIYGGAFSVLSGGFLIAGLIGGCYQLQSYTVILFIISFILMMIIPGHILNHKAKQEL